MKKVYIALMLLVCVAGMPVQAHAGFFSNLVTKVIGSNAQADAIDTGNVNTNNSQTMSLLEPATNPGMGDEVVATKTEPVSIIDPSASALTPITSPLGQGADIEQYASSATISTYVVKKGDTVAIIAKKFKTTESSILYSNADLKKSELLKVGQKLVILPLKPQIEKALAKEDKLRQVTKQEQAPATTKQIQDESSADTDTEGPMFTINTDTPSPSDKTKAVVVPIDTQSGTSTQSKDVTPTTSVGQPNGSIAGGYIWPFDKGAGRVSQGLHADQAYDFTAPVGTPIHAVYGGTVLIAHPTGYNGGYGKYVVINFTDGRQAIFGHMSKVIVAEGDVVSQGDIIGYVGSTGRSTGPHVHIGFHGPLGNPYLGLTVNSTDLETND